MARLHLKVDYDEVARDLGIEGPYTVTYHLHPPDPAASRHAQEAAARHAATRSPSGSSAG